MKKLYLNLIALLFIVPVSLWAQSPAKMSYQAVVRDSNGKLVTNQQVSVRISILQGSDSGTSVYTETQKPETNANGLLSAVIGEGTVVTGNLSTVNWSGGPYFLKTETDPAGGTSYTITGTSQLLSVPYALYAKQSENVNDADADPANEIQTLSLSGTQLSLSKNGGTVTLPAGGSADNWGTQTVVTDASLSGNGLTATPLKIAQQGAASGQVLKWDGTNWKPGNDNNTGFSLPYSSSAASASDAFSITNSLGNAIVGTCNVATGAGVKGIGMNLGVHGQSDVVGVAGTSTTGIAGLFSVSSTSGYALKASGRLIFSGIGEGFGKVLTSDEDGRATWQTPKSLTLPYTNSIDYQYSALEITNSNGYAISGTTKKNNAAGIFGKGAGSGNSIGVYGNTGEDANPALIGNVGVLGQSKANYAVMGTSISGTGGYFSSTSGTALKADGGVVLNGYVGIGTATPGAKLHVKGDTYPNSFVFIQSDAGKDAGMRLYEGSDVKWHIYNNGAAGGLVIGNGSLTNFIFCKQANGYVGINNLAPSYVLDVTGDINASGKVRSAGTILTSDKRLKNDIKPIDVGLNTVSKLQPVGYYKRASLDDSSKGLFEYGFIAQDVQKILPRLISEGADKDKLLSLNYTAIIPILTKAIQEQQAQIKEQQERLEKLERLVSNLMKK